MLCDTFNLQMKFTLGLFAILAIIGLGQAHQFPDFGKGQLHEDLQDILDLVPAEKIAEVIVGYVIHDQEVRDFLKELKNKAIIKDLLVDFQAIPEVINLLDYLRKEGINVYHIINVINRALKIKELVPPSSQVDSLKRRTGGLRGLFKDIKKHIDYDVFISVYVDKLKTSTVFVNFTNQLKSDNFQQIVNKVSEIKSVQFIVKRLEANLVNLKIVRDIMYLVLGINVPSPPKTLVEELSDFMELVPEEEFVNIMVKYINEDEKVLNAVLFLFETEFHDLLRALEATKEHQALVVYLEKAGLPVIESIQMWHRAIGMEKYVPPKIESFFKSLIKTHKIGDGMQGMLKDLYDVLPLYKIDALYEHKMRTSKVFVDFITKMKSKEMKKIINNLVANKSFEEFIIKTKEKGLDIEGVANLTNRMIGLKHLKFN